MAFSNDLSRPFLKLLSLFSLIRGYNIIVLVLAQYLTARYILSPQSSWWNLIIDYNFFSIILASALTTSAGYIINNFYDAAKDQINRPRKYILEHLVSQQHQMILYLFLNMIAFVFASVVSFRAVLFFIFYMIAIWLYSYRIKRLFWLSNLIFCFIDDFTLLGYYLSKNFDTLIFYHFYIFIFFNTVNSVIKDLENFRGDWVQRYKTLPIVYDNTVTKWIITLSLLLSLIPVYLLIQHPLGLMHYYFLLSFPYIFLVLLLLWLAKNQNMYLWLHNLIKLWVLIGVISISLIHQNL